MVMTLRNKLNLVSADHRISASVELGRHPQDLGLVGDAADLLLVVRAERRLLVWRKENSF